ncbi:ArsR/SmtB family transcription factor [Mycolicibacterium hodleri]|uniref:ArsR/SmtB family transcription factor n=1 Tax=Mycolicibacterium hodleri TaxID=49897 RepID=UPI003D160B25
MLQLRESSRCVHELVDALAVPQPLVSQHLRILKSAGVVAGERSGREVRYRLVDHHLSDIVLAAIAHAGEAHAGEAHAEEAHAEEAHAGEFSGEHGEPVAGESR